MRNFLLIITQYQGSDKKISTVFPDLFLLTVFPYSTFQEKEQQESKEDDKHSKRIFVSDSDAEREKTSSSEDYEYEHGETDNPKDSDSSSEVTEFGSRVVFKNRD